MAGCSIVVKRGDLERYELLYKSFGQRVHVMWDRRRSERRKTLAAPDSGERRRAERRGAAPASWRGLGFVVVDR